jgi:DNA-directed RNA polymerase II subunit RPB2
VPRSTKIFVNGKWVGIHRSADILVTDLRQLRRSGDLDAEVSIVRDIRDRELRLYTDAGRCCRPVFIVEDQRLKLKKKHIKKLADQVPHQCHLCLHRYLAFSSYCFWSANTGTEADRLPMG